MDKLYFLFLITTFWVTFLELKYWIHDVVTILCCYCVVQGASSQSKTGSNIMTLCLKKVLIVSRPYGRNYKSIGVA